MRKGSTCHRRFHPILAEKLLACVRELYLADAKLPPQRVLDHFATKGPDHDLVPKADPNDLEQRVFIG
jgi:hypothetical protein